MRLAGGARYTTAVAPLLQARLRVAPDGLSAAPVTRLTFVLRQSASGAESASSQLLVLGGQPADEPAMLALLTIPPVR